ncbi:MAG: hypothetical protein J5835_08040 [Bacteroidales bacterium]|nr:hypothetical protein [Bacteroidales bacterium]
MDENTNIINQEEGGNVDVLAIVNKLWSGRKTVIIWTCVFMVLGLLAAMSMKHEYTVRTVLAPQVNARTSSYASLASMAGFDIGLANMNMSDLSPLVYPQIVESVPYRLELLHTPFHYEKVDTAVSIYTYAKEYSKPTVFATVAKYTIGLPGFLLSKLKKEEPELEYPAYEGDGVDESITKPVMLTRDEASMVKEMGRRVSLMVDKKEGYLAMTVIGSEPLQTAELAIKAIELLQSEVTRFRTEKAQDQLEYIQARYNEVKAETESYQTTLASIKDRSQQMTSTRSRIEQERVQIKYNISSSIYAEMAKQLEQAKMQVKRDTPVLAVVQPVTVPLHSSNSRLKVLITWIFFGFVLGCGVVLLKGYIPVIKESFVKSKAKTQE